MSLCSGLRLSFAVVAAMLLACAEVQPPPGGEADKAGPSLLSSSPANGALNVPRIITVTLLFSEKVQKPAIGTAVFVSPRPGKEPKVKWHADRVEVLFEDSLSANQTYIVSLGSAVMDLRGNKLDSAIALAFSTGETLDSGAISGVVYLDNKPKSGVSVALYPLDTATDSSVIDSLHPAYMTATNSKGAFSLGYLPKREFRLIAFVDKDNNGRFRPVSEMFAMPDRRIQLEERNYPDLSLSLTSWDTTKPEIISATATTDRLIRLRLSRSIPMSDLKLAPSGLQFKTLNDTLAVYAAQGILESELKESAQLTAYCANLPDSTYRVELQYDLQKPPLVWDSLVVRALPDKAAPAVTGVQPGAAAVFTRDFDLTMTFSEPLDTMKFTPQTFAFWEGKANPVPVHRRWNDPFHLTLLPEELIAGANYRLDITEFEIVDLAGNRMGDTLKTYTFSTLNEDSLGTVSGELTIDLPDRRLSPVFLTFASVGTNQQYRQTSTDRTFRLDLPAGKYMLSGFVDTDRNSKRGLGGIYPFTLSETASAYPDTIAVRARFETAGLNFEFK
ncbi:MAG: Ig-like domain-containing protein [Candidatus Zixiibacteriota bacterium]